MPSNTQTTTNAAFYLTQLASALSTTNQESLGALTGNLANLEARVAALEAGGGGGPGPTGLTLVSFFVDSDPVVTSVNGYVGPSDFITADFTYDGQTTAILIGTFSGYAADASSEMRVYFTDNGAEIPTFSNSTVSAAPSPARAPGAFTRFGGTVSILGRITPAAGPHTLTFTGTVLFDSGTGFPLASWESYPGSTQFAILNIRSPG